MNCSKCKTIQKMNYQKCNECVRLNLLQWWKHQTPFSIIQVRPCLSCLIWRAATDFFNLESAGSIVLKFAICLETFTSHACYTSHGWAPNVCTCPMSGFAGAFSWNMGIVWPINYESYTAMSKVYLHVFKWNCTSFYTMIYSLPLV